MPADNNTKSPLSENGRYLYNTMKEGGADVGTEQEFHDFLNAPMEQGYKNRKQVWDTLRAAGADVGTYEDFKEFLGVHAVKPRQAAPTEPAEPAKAPGEQTPTAEDYARAARETATVVARGQETLQRSERQHKWQKANFGLSVPRTEMGLGKEDTGLHLGENSHVVETEPTRDAETGEVRRTYVTESGNEYDNRAGADWEQNAWDAAERQQAQARRMNRAMQDVERERKEKTDEIDKQIAVLEEQYNGISDTDQGAETRRGYLRQAIDRLHKDRDEVLKKSEGDELKIMYERGGGKEIMDAAKRDMAEEAAASMSDTQKALNALGNLSPSFGLKLTANVADLIHRWTNSDYGQAKAAQQSLEDTENTIKQANRRGWSDNAAFNVVRGAWDSASDIRTWDFGATDWTNTHNVASLVDKAERIREAEEAGETPQERLTATEQKVLDALALSSTMEASFAEHVPMMYRVGQSVPQSAGFAASIYLNPLNSVGQAVGKSVAANAAKGGAKAVARGVAREAGKAVARQVAGDVATAAEQTAQRALTMAAVAKYGKWGVRAMNSAGRVAGDAVEALGTTLTTGLPRTMATINERQTGTLLGRTDDRGRIVYDRADGRETGAKSYLKGGLSAFFENESEMWGEYFSPIKNFANAAAKDMGFARRAVETVSASPVGEKMALLNKFRQKAHISGLMGEYMEEVLNNMADAICIGDMNFTGGVWKPKREDYSNDEDYQKAMEAWQGSVFNAETNLETFLSVAAMLAPMAAVEKAGKYYNSYAARRELSNAADALTKAIGQEKATALMQSMQDAESLEDVGKIYIQAMQDGSVTDEKQAKALLDYAGRLSASQSVNTSDAMADLHASRLQRGYKDAYAAGHEMAVGDRHQAAVEFDQATEEARQMFGESFVRSVPRMDLDGFERLTATMSEQQREVAERLYLTGTRLHGIFAGSADAVAEETGKYANTLHAMQDEDGNVWRGSGLASDEYIVPSSVQDGSATVVVKNAQTGTLRMIPREQAGEITSMGVDEELKATGERLQEQARRKVEWNINHNNNTVRPRVGETVTIGENKEGAPMRMRIMRVGEDGRLQLLPTRMNGETGEEEPVSGQPVLATPRQIINAQDAYYDAQDAARRNKQSSTAQQAGEPAASTDGAQSVEEPDQGAGRTQEEDGASESPLTTEQAKNKKQPQDEGAPKNPLTAEQIGQALDATEQGASARAQVDGWMRYEDDAQAVHDQIDQVDDAEWDAETKRLLHEYVEKRKVLWSASTEHSTTSGESQDFPSAPNTPESDDVSALSQSPSSEGKGRDISDIAQEESGKSSVREPMSRDEADAFVTSMESRAKVAPEVELSIENWDSLFGKDGLVQTPIGMVKMGDNQFTKMMREGRNSKLGMIKPTLESPDAIIEVESRAKEGDTEERPSSLIFVRAFKKEDGSRFYYFTSVTVMKDGREVIVSNQEKRRNAIANLLSTGKLVWRHADDVSDASDVAQGLYSSQGNASDLATEGTDAPQTEISSEDKGRDIFDIAQEEGGKSSVREPAKPTLEDAVRRKDAGAAWDAIVEEAGGDERIAQTVAKSMLADKEEALKKAERAKPRKADTIAGKIAAERERQVAVEKAKAELTLWQEIVATPKQRVAEEARRQSEQTRLEAEAKAQEEARAKTEQEEAERKEREALQGVPDMSEDRPQDARARGYRRLSGHKYDRQEPLEHLEGKEVSVKFSNDATVKGHVAVIEAGQLQPSHLQGQRNPYHFIDEAQPKERVDDASVTSAQKMAAAMRPEEITSSVTAYTGAPTVNSRGEVIQGNSRGDALRLMWQGYKEQAEAYKQYLVEHAGEFGLDADAVARMERPVLVNMLDVDDQEAIALGQYVAQDTESGGTERIKPKNALQKMGGDMKTFAGMLLRTNDDAASLGELLDSNGLDVLKWMNAKGYISDTQYMSAFDSKGNLTAEARNDLKGILYQSIFKGGSTRLEEMFNTLPARAQRAILATAYRDFDSPNMERMVGEIQNSIMAYNALMSDQAFAEAKNFGEAHAAAEAWKRQYYWDDASGESYLPGDRYSNFALLLATMYKGQSQGFIQETFNNLYDLIQGVREETLFDKPDNMPRTLAQAIREELNIEYDGQQRGNVLAGPAEAGQQGKQGGTESPATGERAAEGTGAAQRGTGSEDNNHPLSSQNTKPRNAEDAGNGQQDSSEKNNTDKITPIGESDFGFVYDQFKGNAQGAIQQLMKMQDGEALGALHHDGIGDIDLVWGKAGTRKSDGYGLAKLVKFHPEVLDNLQGILGGMHITKRSENRVQLENDEYQATVRLTWNGDEKLWLLTAFKKKETSEPTNSRTDVDSNLDGKSDDTATRQSSDASFDKGSEISATDKKEDGKTKKKAEKEEHTSQNAPSDLFAEAERMAGEEATQAEKPRLQKADDYSEFATAHGLDADGVRKYAEGMATGNLALAAQGFSEIRRAKRLEHHAENPFSSSFSEFAKVFGPIKKSLYDKFGNIDELRQEYIRREEEEHSMMEAARKRVEEEEAKKRQRLEELSLLTSDEIDRQYADAIEKGDERTAREMLDEAARRKGYGDTNSDYQGVGAWAAPLNPGYESDEARRADVENNAPDVNLEDMALGYNLQPDDYFTHPERYSQNTPHGRESVRAIQAALDALKRGDKDVRVRVYRAVPTSVKEGSLRNGDWVTPSRKYAEMHGNSRLEGKYRIIEDEVLAKDLWWDGNDANEFGYDNGKGYKYKNVKNNRKLDDLVTRDNKGNIIPPSQRFNQRKADERYQRDDGTTKLTEEEKALRDALAERLRNSGLEVIDDAEEGQRVLDAANGKARLSAKQKRALETASPEMHSGSLTVVSSADGAKILQSLELLAKDFDNSATQPKTFMGNVAKALGAKRYGSASEYATFEARNGKIVTIRLANHNATTSNFDANGEADGISIVVSPRPNEGIRNDGNAHITEFYYNSLKLRKAEGKPLAAIVRSIKQALYSGEFKDTTGLAEVQEVNAGTVEGKQGYRFFRTDGGEAYGFTVGGKIYLDPRVATAETPIHEYAHLWATALRQGNPKEWKNVVGLMKGTPVWDEVRRRYPELKTDDEIADEVLAHYSGRRGAERLRQEAAKATEGNESIFDKAAAMSAMQRVRQALVAFWKGVADFLHIHYTSAEDVADKVMADLLDGVNPQMANEGKTLVGVHNISEEKLESAIKQGGLANPSVAVVDSAKQGHEGYGEISLLMPSSMIAKSTGHNAGTFFGDAYTPRYPQVERIFGKGGSERAEKDIASVPEFMQRMTRNAINSWMDGRGADDLAYLYLHETGRKPEAVRHEAKFTPEVTEGVYRIMGQAKEIKELDDAQKQALAKIYLEEKGQSAEELKQGNAKMLEILREEIAKEPEDSRKRMRLERQAAAIEKYGMPMSELSGFVSDVKTSKYLEGKELDYATMRKAKDYIHENGLEKDFKQWREGLAERYGIKEVLFAGYTPSGNRRYVPNDLEHASRMMRQAGRAGAEGMNVSFNNFAATVMERTGTTQGIRKRKGQLTTKQEDVDAFTEKWEKVYNGLADALNPNPSGLIDDTGYYRLQETALQPNPKAFAKKEYGVDLTDEDVQRLHDLVNAIRTERPTLYFETKFERPVGLNEFAAAVVPSTLSDEVRKGLEDAGLPLFVYDRKKPGDRRRAFNEAAQSDGHIRFQRAESEREDESLERANERFNEELDAFKAKSHKGLLHLGRPGSILRASGINAESITISPTVLHRHLKKHGLTTDDLKGLARSIQTPILVYRHGKKSPNIVVVTELDVKGGKLSASFELDGNGEVVEVSNISSVHSKDAEKELRRLYNMGEKDFKDALRWVEKEKVLDWLAPSSYKPSDMQTNEAPFDIAKVVQDFENPATEDENLYRVVDDQATIDRLESEPKMTAYRAMQVIDGRLYSPMAAKVDGRLTADNPMGAWTEAEETALDFTDKQREAMDALDRSDRKGDVDIIKGRLRYHKESKTGRGTLQFHLVKGDGGSLWAAYNPYIHSSLMMLNDQFTSAYKRPNIVVVEVEIPKSELTSGYRAERAKDPVGMAEWKAGPVAGQLPSDMGRKVMLSRWSKVKRIVPYTEVADHVAAILSTAESKKGESLRLPVDSFHPELRKELEKRGFKFEPGQYTREKTGKDGKVQKSWDDSTEAEKQKAYNGAAYMDDAAIARLNDEYQGEWLRREGDGGYTSEELSQANDPYAKMLGRNRHSANQQAVYAERMRERMAAKATELAEKLHLNNIEVVTDASRPEGRQRKAKGFYNKRTGKITIVVPNHESLADVEQTLLHEAVAHHGLRELFGERFDQFLDNVYDHAETSIRERIDASMMKNGWDKRTATEEYLASLAEQTDFETTDPGFWMSIKRAFLDMLRSLGFDYQGPELSDNELRYILWRSYKNLEEPGSFRSILGEAEDQKKQEELGVGYNQPDGTNAEAAEAMGGEAALDKVNERFNHELTRYQNGEMDKNAMLHLGRPQGVMRAFLPNLPIVMRQRVIKKGSEKKHEVDVSAIMNMPQHLSSPIFVFQRSENTIGVLTDMRDRNGKNVCVAIELKRTIQQGAEYLEVNDVRSFHGREFNLNSATL